jgi:hypothetical protein
VKNAARAPKQGQTERTHIGPGNVNKGGSKAGKRPQIVGIIGRGSKRSNGEAPSRARQRKGKKEWEHDTEQYEQSIKGQGIVDECTVKAQGNRGREQRER